MAFNYHKHKSNEGHSEAQWTSYSDLFMSLSVIFLLLYVASSLKQGTSAVQQAIQNQQLTQEVDELRQQIKVYNTLKEDYMETGANAQEKQVYEGLMKKLTLLQDEAKDEKNDLMRKARENGEKEQALNQYQKLIKNIINSNVVAQARLKRRDVIIQKKEDVIAEKFKTIRILEKEVTDKKALVAKSERKIQEINGELNDRMTELQKAYERQEITKKSFEKEVDKVKSDSARRLEWLKSQNKEVTEQLADASSKLVAVNTDLETARGTIEKQGKEKGQLQKQLEETAAKYSSQIKGLEAEYEAKRSKERAAFEKSLKAQKLSGEARAAKEAAFKAAAEEKASALAGRIADLNSKMRQTEGALGEARALANARKNLAAQIKKNFEANGIKADVDGNTGDVVLDFGERYFDTGKADLKTEMKQVLEKAMPVYSTSLLEDKKIANKIKSVEIVGFASPTYKGKYIDPQTLSQGDRTAVDYNLDLSYSRARAIFKHIFDTNKMTFKHQKQLLPLVKVTGRSFLAQPKGGVAEGASGKDFCEKRDCMKAQRVIIKFSLED